jgi:hypothetical protein
MKTGIELITQERQEQINKHGFDNTHDKHHDDESLSFNAAVLATPIVLFEKGENFANSHIFTVATIDNGWKLPYQARDGNKIIDNNTLSKKERIKQLIVAGALIAAEIDRLQTIDNN